jgi:hypothetical protein
MGIQDEHPIPTVDWTKVSNCCDGGRCGAPVQKPATSAQLAVDSPLFVRQLEPQSPQPPSIEECEEVAVDMVKEPPHYARFKIQPLDAINDWKLPFALGCVVKYIVRAPYKGTEILDIEKAEEFLRRYKAYRMAQLNADEPVKVSER